MVTLVERHVERRCRIGAHDENVEFPVQREIARNDVEYRRRMSQLRAPLERKRIWRPE